MEDFIKDAPEAVAAVGATVTAVGTWVSSKFEWWKNTDSKFVKIGVPLGIFIASMFVLSLVH